MENRSGQVSAEFMILIALVLIIFIPLFAILSFTGLDTTQRIDGERVGAIARTILDEAREIYYLGEGSRQTITVDIPRVVNATQIVNTTTTYELIFVFIQAGAVSTTSHPSEVPIRIGGGSVACSPAPRCAGPGCECLQFEPESIRPGLRNIELRTERDPDGLYVSMRVLS